jgi:hypothetical protein
VVTLKFGLDFWKMIEMGPYYLDPNDYAAPTQASGAGAVTGQVDWPSRSTLRNMLVQRLRLVLNGRPAMSSVQQAVDEFLNTHKIFVESSCSSPHST